MNKGHRERDYRLQEQHMLSGLNVFNIKVPLLLKAGKTDVKKKNRCVQTSVHADVLFCIILFLFFVILHRLFLTSNVLKLAGLRVPHTFDLDLEFCHLDAKEFQNTSLLRS